MQKLFSATSRGKLSSTSSIFWNVIENRRALAYNNSNSEGKISDLPKGVGQDFISKIDSLIPFQVKTTKMDPLVQVPQFCLPLFSSVFPAI